MLLGCAPESATPESYAHASETQVAQDGVVPEPGRTIEAEPPTEVENLSGYRIAVVTRDAASASLLDAAREFARERGAELSEFPAPSPDIDGVDAALDAALADNPDVVVGLGAGVVDLFSFETSQLLDQQFLVIGAQIAEPTDNVTAVIWDGATSRGSAASADGELDDASATHGRGWDAFSVGVTSIRSGVTGVVLRLE